jgi:hypothetical protein
MSLHIVITAFSIAAGHFRMRRISPDKRRLRK